MPINGLAEENSKPSINNEGEHDSGITNALSRLKTESTQAMAYIPKGRRDVTDEFTNVSKQLQPGQLVKDEHFTLFEAVGALEIMDAKMDSGYVPPDDTLEPEFDPSSRLDAVEVVWIMDQLLCLEITWLDGYPLSQTVYTSLHIDRLLSADKVRKDTFHHGSNTPPPTTDEDAPVHKVLHAYCVALVKCCQLVLHLVQSQNFYEEEDFVTHLFGRELLLEIGSNTADDSLVEALDWVYDCSLAHDVKQALATRCEFRRTLLRTLADDAQQWDSMVDGLRHIKESHSVAKAIPAAFSEKIQRQLATSTPPRPMIQVPFDIACSKWTQLCEDIMAAYDLTDPTIAQSPHCLQRAVWAFAYRGQPGTLARAQMQNLLFSAGCVAGEIAHYDLMLTDLSDLVLAGDPLVDPRNFSIEVTSDPRHICSKMLKGFMEKAIEEYLNFYRMVCQNRCRIRRTFTQAIPILDAVLSEAENVDRELEKHWAPLKQKIRNPNRSGTFKTNPLQSWCRFHTLQIVAWTIQLGFETDVYLPDELARMYRFLSLVCVSRSYLIEHMLCCTSERKKNMRDTQHVDECASSEVFLKSLAHSAEVTQSLAEALYKFCNLLTRVGVIVAPKRDFAQAQLLYETRMKPFLSLKNEDLPCLEGFEEEIEEQNKVSFNDTLKSIDTDLRWTKSVLVELKKYAPDQAKYIGTEEEWKKEIKQMETVCVAIAVATSQLKRIREKHGPDHLSRWVDCSFEKKYHEWWVIPQLKERIAKWE